MNAKTCDACGSEIKDIGYGHIEYGAQYHFCDYQCFVDWLEYGEEYSSSPDDMLPHEYEDYPL